MWSLKSVEFALQALVVCAHVPVDKPFSFFYSWILLVLSEPVASVTSLTPDECRCLLLDSLVELCLGQQWLSFENFLIEYLATKALIYTAIYIVVSDLSLLLHQEHFDNQTLCFLTNKSSWLSNNLYLFVVFREYVCQVIIDLRSNFVEIVIWVLAVHRKTSANINYVECFHFHLFCQLKDKLCILKARLVHTKLASTASDMERNSSQSDFLILTSLQD